MLTCIERRLHGLVSVQQRLLVGSRWAYQTLSMSCFKMQNAKVTTNTPPAFCSGSILSSMWKYEIESVCDLCLPEHVPYFFFNKMFLLNGEGIEENNCFNFT